MKRNKKGYMLALVLVIMVMGVVIIIGLSHYLGASLLLATKSEERAINFYAADSGFEDACFWLKNYQDLPGWEQSGENQWERDPYVINGRTVDVDVIQVGNYSYKVTSSASMNDTVSTVIESYVVASTLNLSFLGDNAITSNGDVLILGAKGGVQGNVEYVGTITCPGDPYCDDSVEGEIIHSPDGLDYWPSTQDLIDYFFHQVYDLEPFPDDAIDVAVTPTIGPLFRDGDLQILSTVKNAYASLNGTVYVKGDLDIWGPKDFTLNLSHHFIFCEGNIDMKPQSTIVGTGGIIAIGDIFFGPQSSSDENDYVFIMSSVGEVRLNPNSNYYGSVAGETSVELFPGVELIWTDPQEAGFQFPSFEKLWYRTYEIIKE